MKQGRAKQKIPYRRDFYVLQFAIGVLVLGAIWFVASLTVTVYAQGLADRVAGYVDKPVYMTYESEVGRIAFDYPSTLNPTKGAFSSNYVTFEQLDVDKRVLESNENGLYASLLVQEQVSGYEMTQADYFQRSLDRACQDTTSGRCSSEQRTVNGEELLIVKNKSALTRIDYGVYIWTADYTYELHIAGTMDATNSTYVEHILSSIEVSHE